MKKALSLLLTSALACTALAGCNNGKGTQTSPVTDGIQTENTEEVTEPSINDMTDPSSEIQPDASEPDELKEPELLWCQVYNPNGFNTVTGIIHNPNSVAIDATFDLVFYKAGSEVGRVKDFYAGSVANDHDHLIWGNNDIPDPDSVDEVKLEIVSLYTTLYPPVSAKYSYTETVDNKAYFDFSFEKPITIGDVWFLLYNDTNGNKQPDVGEVVVVSSANTTAQEDKLYFSTDVFSYTDYAVYYCAY